MATESTTPPTPTPPPVVNWQALLSMLWQLFPSSFLKTMLGFLLGGATAGYVVSHQVESAIKGTPKGIIDKLLPHRSKPADAIGQIRFGSAGCSATIIGPVEADDQVVEILTAAHCVKVGQDDREG